MDRSGRGGLSVYLDRLRPGPERRARPGRGVVTSIELDARRNLKTTGLLVVPSGPVLLAVAAITVTAHC